MKKKKRKLVTVRISAEAHAALKKMAQEEGRTIMKVLDLVLAV